MAEPQRKLERASLEAYGGIALAIFLAVLPMNWWLKAAAFAVLASLAVDISCRSPWTFRWSQRSKILASIISVAIIVSIAYNPVTKQYLEDRKPTKAAFVLTITDLAGCSFLPPYPPNSELITLWVKLDNQGASSVAKDWSLEISPPHMASLKAAFYGLGERHDLICGRHMFASDALELKTEDKQVIGVTRGQLGFVETGIPPQEIADPSTILTLSVRDSDGNSYKTIQRVGDLGPRLIVPPAEPPPIPAPPGKS